MIGQHIYSRCLEGYFSKSGVNADSTTVTISMNMFSREDQAKRIARECEKISTLEDVRPVPSEIMGAYRGVLKICRLSRQITVVCRAYRLHSDQGNIGGGESRDFTYASSYILTGKDKEQFLYSPEYCLNIQDFESYPSVMDRIRESRYQGKGGRIEANDSFSLFNSKCREITPEIFQQAGFTRELFVDYISSIIQRVSYSHYSGHENDKVLVILPQRFNQPWERCGGNVCAEEVLAATMKYLPKCVAEQLSATTGGIHDPQAFVLEGYQLVFMEPGNTKDWRHSEYSIIDLDQQTSVVSEELDRTYGEFLWDHLSNLDACREFEIQYKALFNEEAEQDHAPEKFALVLNIQKEKESDFINGMHRNRLLIDLLEFFQDHWSEDAQKEAYVMLSREIEWPCYDRRLELNLLGAIQNESFPEELKPLVITILVQDIFAGNATKESVQWICGQIREKNDIVSQKVSEANWHVQIDKETAWHTAESLMNFYMNICKDSEIFGDESVKSQILIILSSWYSDFLGIKDWKNCIAIIRILAKQLEDTNLPQDRQKEIYQNLLYLLFTDEEIEQAVRSDISDMIKQEERTFGSAPQKLDLFRECFQREAEKTDIVINEEVIWHLTYLAVSGDEIYLQNQWRSLHANLIKQFACMGNGKWFEKVRECFESWRKKIKDENKLDKLDILYEAIGISEENNLRYGCYYPSMKELREEVIAPLIEYKKERLAAELIYTHYKALDKDDKKNLFQEMNMEERWMLSLTYSLKKESDEILDPIKKELVSKRRDYLKVAASFRLTDEEIKIAADIYLELCDGDVYENQKNGSLLSLWCNVYENEYSAIQSVSPEFYEYVRDGFRDRIVRSDPDITLNISDVLFLRNKGILLIDEGVEYLDVVGDLYAADPTMCSEKFRQIRKRIISEDKRNFKKIYQDALGKKRKSLIANHIREELLYNVVLLEEQISLDLNGTDENLLKNIVGKIYVDASAKDQVLTILNLLRVIEKYGYFQEQGAYNCERLRKQLIDKLGEAAGKKVEIFEDEQIVSLYKELGTQNKQELEQRNFKRNLQELSREWQSKYGIRETRSRSEKILPGIFAGTFLLLGIALEIFFFFMYGNISSQTAFITGIVQIAIGVIGDIVVMLLVLFTLID